MTNKVKKWVIAVAIAIVFNLFVNYGVATFYPGPEYADYCKESSPFRAAEPALFGKEPYKECQTVEVSQGLRDGCAEQKGFVAYKYNSTGCPTEAYCETCQAEYDSVRKVHDGNVFVALVIVAVIALAAGIILKAEAVSTGFLLAGIIDLVVAATRYWEHLQNIYRFLLLGVVLAVLVWLGYRKVK